MPRPGRSSPFWRSSPRAAGRFHSRRTRILLTAAVAALALVAVGCGGDDDSDADPTAAWASDFCSAITTWTDELQTVTSQFSDTSNLSQEGLQSAWDDVRAATESLVD